MGETELFTKAMFSSYNELVKYKADLDRLNVFPVADSDTGTNMCRTMKAGIDALRREKISSINDGLDKMSKAMLRNARGNSGVILSAGFKGFSSFVKNKTQLDCDVIHGGFENAIKEVSAALFNPRFEGTILSVLTACRDVFEKNREKTVAQVFSLLSQEAKRITAQTKNQLSVLKNADVVDSGAMGLSLIINSIDKTLNNLELSQANPNFSSTPKMTVNEAKPPCVYCTEFIIVRKNDASDKTLERALSVLGESLAIVTDKNIIKVHIHTNTPNHVLSYALKFGQLTDIKIDNMALQAESVYGNSLIDS